MPYVAALSELPCAARRTSLGGAAATRAASSTTASSARMRSRTAGCSAISDRRISAPVTGPGPPGARPRRSPGRLRLAHGRAALAVEEADARGHEAEADRIAGRLARPPLDADDEPRVAGRVDAEEGLAPERLHVGDGSLDG